ncbi:MAG: hypothetical protein Q8S57_09355 [Methanoregula sp.]|nr:hypothetical protein [Methanoregula sp.]
MNPFASFLENDKIVFVGGYNRNQSPGPGGWMRAGTRRPSPCRVSIGRAREDQGCSTGQAYVGRSGREEGESGTGPHQRACRTSLQGGPTIAKKDNARRRYCTNPAGLLRSHGVPVGPPFIHNEKRFFSSSCAATI